MRTVDDAQQTFVGSSLQQITHQQLRRTNAQSAEDQTLLLRLLALLDSTHEAGGRLSSPVGDEPHDRGAGQPHRQGPQCLRRTSIRPMPVIQTDEHRLNPCGVRAVPRAQATASSDRHRGFADCSDLCGSPPTTSSRRSKWPTGVTSGGQRRRRRLAQTHAHIHIGRNAHTTAPWPSRAFASTAWRPPAQVLARAAAKMPSPSPDSVSSEPRTSPTQPENLERTQSDVTPGPLAGGTSRVPLILSVLRLLANSTGAPKPTPEYVRRCRMRACLRASAGS